LHYYNLRIRPICPKICLFLQNKKIRRTFGAMASTGPLGSTSGKSWELIRISITQLLLNTFETCHCVGHAWPSWQSWTMYSIWNANTLSGMTYPNSSTSYNLTGSHWRIRYASALLTILGLGILTFDLKCSPEVHQNYKFGKIPLNSPSFIYFGLCNYQ